MNNPVVTACACTGEPKSILDEAGMPLLAVGGVCLCPYCGRNPFGVDPEHPDVKACGRNPFDEALARGTKLWDEARGIRRDMPGSEGGEA